MDSHLAIITTKIREKRERRWHRVQSFLGPNDNLLLHSWDLCLLLCYFMSLLPQLSIPDAVITLYSNSKNSMYKIRAKKGFKSNIALLKQNGTYSPYRCLVTWKPLCQPTPLPFLYSLLISFVCFCFGGGKHSIFIMYNFRGRRLLGTA